MQRKMKYLIGIDLFWNDFVIKKICFTFFIYIIFYKKKESLLINKNYKKEK